MKFSINNRIFEKFPSLSVGVVIAKNLDNTGESKDIEPQLRQIEQQILAKYSTEQMVVEPRIAAWRNAYISFGAKPKEHRSSVENLYRMVLRGVELKHINQLVDIYNLLSLKHMVPVGGEDIDKINGDVQLTLAGPSEQPTLLLGDKEPRPPHEGEVIYKDSESAICRRFNWREANRTKLTEQTKNAILVIEGLPPVTEAEVEKATTELAEMIQLHCKGKTIYKVLNKENPEIEF